MALRSRTALLMGIALFFLAACEDGFNIDLRNALGASGTKAAPSGSTEPRPEPDERGIISYPNYQVAVANRGDTVADVATRVGLNANDLRRYNGIGENVLLRKGEIIALPRRVSEPLVATATTIQSDSIDITSLAASAIERSGPETRAKDLAPVVAPGLPDGPEPIRHKVERGETAFSISRLYDVPVSGLAQWNGLSSDLAVREGQYLLIPITTQTSVSAAVTSPGTGTATPTPPSATQPQPTLDTTPAALAPAPVTPASPNLGAQATAPTKQAQMAFPASGNIIRAYRKGRNEGIDIGATAGASVSAAANGIVAAITRDTNQVAIIVIKHDASLLTVYTNVDNLVVKKGDTVKRGQKIASVRNADPSFLHFEVRDGLDSVDPMIYLE